MQPRSARTARRRSLGALILALFTALALTGCIKVDLSMTINENDTVDSDVVIAFANTFAHELGMTPDEMWQAVSGQLGENMPEGTTVEPYAEDGFTGSRITLLSQNIADMTDVGGEELHVVREGNEFVFTGHMDLTGALEGRPVDQEDLDAMDVSLSVTFPGAVTDANGDIDGNTVTWHPAPGEITDFQARGSALADGSSSGIPTWVWAVAAVAVLAIIALAAFLILSRRKEGEAIDDNERALEAGEVDAASHDVTSDDVTTVDDAPVSDAPVSDEAVSDVEPVADEPVADVPEDDSPVAADQPADTDAAFDSADEQAPVSEDEPQPSED
jgi:hypothetical protein